ncbi:hypothetical protein AgCh_015867 [Apium graveolens]
MENTFKISPFWYLRSVFIIGKNIYLVDETSKVLVFSLSSGEWVIGRELQSPSIIYVDTNKGVLFKANLFGSNASRFRMNDNCRDWEKLKVEELVNEYWFVEAWPNDAYVVSKDIHAAISHEMVESGNMKR